MYFLGRHGCDEEGAYLYFDGNGHELMRREFMGTCYESFEEILDIEIYLEEDFPDIKQRLVNRLLLLGIFWDGNIEEDLEYLNMSNEELQEEFEMEHVKVYPIKEKLQGYRMAFERFNEPMKFTSITYNGIMYARLEPTELPLMETGNEVSVFGSSKLECTIPPLALRLEDVVLVLRNHRLQICVPCKPVEESIPITSIIP